MATLAAQALSSTAFTTATYSAATSGAGGDLVRCGNGYLIHVKNGSGSTLTATFVLPGTTPPGDALPSHTATITAGADGFIRVPDYYSDPANPGYAKVTWSAVTSVTVASLQV